MVGIVWLLVVLIAATSVVSSGVRVGLKRSRNRLLLSRAEWAREACAEILLGRYARASRSGQFDPSALARDTVDLGRETWCAVALEDPGTRINLNLADSLVLGRLFGDSVLVRQILGSRPFESIEQVEELPAFDTSGATRLQDFTTVRGTGRVNLNAAPSEVLHAALGLPAPTLTALLERRAAGSRVSDPAEIGTINSQAATGGYHELLARTTAAPEQLIARVVGGVGISPLRARAVLTLVPLPGRLAVLRRETE